MKTNLTGFRNLSGLINKIMEKKLKAFEELLHIMDELREKCPWDRVQTLETLRTLSIEEVYELSDAIIQNDLEGIKEEVGDLMLHLVFYAKIGNEKGAFDIADVLDGINKKLIHRHPHVFGDTKVSGTKEVLQNWEELKLKEKKGKKKVLSGVPKSLPALIKAYRIQDKVSGVGFDWDYKEQVWDKVAEEIEEFKSEELANDKEKMEKEFGDVFFALINAARLYGINPEDALEKTNQKFMKRFNYLESKTIQQGKSLHDLNLQQMDVFWEEAKKQEK